jgi:hypothetical protein
MWCVLWAVCGMGYVLCGVGCVVWGVLGVVLGCAMVRGVSCVALGCAGLCGVWFWYVVKLRPKKKKKKKYIFLPKLKFSPFSYCAAAEESSPPLGGRDDARETAGRHEQKEAEVLRDITAVKVLLRQTRRLLERRDRLPRRRRTDAIVRGWNLYHPGPPDLEDGTLRMLLACRRPESNILPVVRPLGSHHPWWDGTLRTFRGLKL